jgi:hypothetical protein
MSATPSLTDDTDFVRSNGYVLDPARDLERFTLMQYSAMEWHLQHNLYPPMDRRLATPCLEAIEHFRQGNPVAPIAINGATEIKGKPITASLLIGDLALGDFLVSCTD